MICPELTLLFYSETGLLTCPSWPWTHSGPDRWCHLGRPFLVCGPYISLLKWQSTSGTAPCCLWLWCCSESSKENQPACQPKESRSASLSLVDSRKYNSKYLMKAHFWPSAVCVRVGSGSPRWYICCYRWSFPWRTFSSGLQVNKGWLSVLTLLLKTHINLKNLDNCFHSDHARQRFLTPKWSEADTVLMFSFLNVWWLNLPDHSWILLWLTYGNEENNHLVLVRKIRTRI